MTNLDDNRLVRTFAELRATGKHTLLPFITAGYPDLETTEAILHDFERRGVTICELGIPFSDPIADGPTIQASYTAALDNGIAVEDILQTVRKFRDAGGDIALIAMVSYSIVFRRGPDAFLAAARDAGFDAIIVPDLSLEEAGDFEQLTASHNMCNVMLIAPTSTPERKFRIAGHSRGFIYYISVAGITGERDHLPDDTISAVAELRKHTDTPICVGFGISNPQTVETVCKVADGAIVGSAIVHRITDTKDAPLQERVATIGAFVADLLAPLT
jgi:tryptophan synthase alpha chain